MRRVGLVVGVRAGGEAAGAGWRATVVRDGTRPGACAGTLQERTLLLAARTNQGGAEGTLLAAQHGRGGRGRGVRAREVAFGQPLGVRDGCWGGKGRGGRGWIPQRAVLFDQAAVQALV